MYRKLFIVAGMICSLVSMCFSFAVKDNGGYFFEGIDVVFRLEETGLIHVQESFDTSFVFSREGITRTLYTNSHDMKITNIHSDNYQLTVAPSDESLDVGIISTKPLLGDHMIDVSYDMHGAVIEGTGADLFSWYFDGIQWNIPVKSLSWVMQLPTQHYLPDDAVTVLINDYVADESRIHVRQRANNLIIHLTGGLQPYDSLMLQIALPADMITNSSSSVMGEQYTMPTDITFRIVCVVLGIFMVYFIIHWYQLFPFWLFGWLRIPRTRMMPSLPSSLLFTLADRNNTVSLIVSLLWGRYAGGYVTFSYHDDTGTTHDGKYVRMDSTDKNPDQLPLGEYTLYQQFFPTHQRSFTFYLPDTVHATLFMNDANSFASVTRLRETMHGLSDQLYDRGTKQGLFYTSLSTLRRRVMYTIRRGVGGSACAAGLSWLIGYNVPSVMVYFFVGVLPLVILLVGLSLRSVATGTKTPLGYQMYADTLGYIRTVLRLEQSVRTKLFADMNTSMFARYISVLLLAKNPDQIYDSIHHEFIPDGIVETDNQSLCDRRDKLIYETLMLMHASIRTYVEGSAQWWRDALEEEQQKRDNR